MLKTIIAASFITIVVYGCKSKEKASDPADQELIRLNNTYDSAIIAHDTATLRRLYADDFVFTNPEGKLLSRQEQITSIAVSEVNWEAGRSEDVKVKIYDNTAVMTGAFFAKGSYRGNPLTINERYTAVWIKTDTSWQMVAEQGTIVK